MPLPERIEDIFEFYYRTLVDRVLALYKGSVRKVGIISLSESMRNRIISEYEGQGWVIDFKKRNSVTMFTFVQKGAEDSEKQRSEEEEQNEEQTEDEADEQEEEQSGAAE